MVKPTVPIPPPISTTYASTTPLLLLVAVSPMENMDILRLVVSFIGPKQYRFIATISQRFHAAYVHEFPNDTATIINASTVEYAKICWNEMKHPLTYQQHSILSHSATIFGSVSAMQYLRSVGCPWSQRTCFLAAEHGHLHILQMARDYGYPWSDVRTCTVAAKNGHLHIVQYARDNGCPWDKETCANAAWNGHFNILQYARKYGCPCDELTCVNAAWNGHLHILHYARENGCPCDELTCVNAALNGHLHILQYARIHGCPWNNDKIEHAAEFGRLQRLKNG